MNRQNKKTITNKNKVTFVSIREQKQHQNMHKSPQPSSPNHFSKPLHPHKPLARQKQETTEMKRARLPLYHPSRFR